MQKILVQLSSFLLTSYFASIIIFKMYNYEIVYIINALMIGVFILLMVINRESNYKINGFIVFYAIFVLVALGSSLWSVNFVEASFKSLQLFLILINMFFIYNFMKKFHLEHTFLNGILIGSFVNFIILLNIVPVSFEIITAAGGGRALGTTGNPNMLAIIMLISLLVSLIYISNKDTIHPFLYYYQYINIILSLYLIFLTMSKKGIIFGSLLILSYLFLALKQGKEMLRLVIFSIIGFVLIMNFMDIDHLMEYYEHVEKRFDAFQNQLENRSNSGSTGERLFLVNKGLQLFGDKPLLGYGIANFVFLNDRNIYAHNNYIELLVGVGLIGTLAYYSIYVYIIRKAFFMSDRHLKMYIIYFTFILLAMDMALVSYGLKSILFTLLLLSIIIEKNINKVN